MFVSAILLLVIGSVRTMLLSLRKTRHAPMGTRAHRVMTRSLDDVGSERCPNQSVSQSSQSVI